MVRFFTISTEYFAPKARIEPRDKIIVCLFDKKVLSLLNYTEVIFRNGDSHVVNLSNLTKHHEQ